MFGIYKITNKTNNKVYIGKSTNIEERLYMHKYNLNKNQHCNNYLQNSWNKYGENNFTFEIIEENVKDENELNKLEIYYIKEYKSQDLRYGYNIMGGGEGGIMPDTVKEKISVSKRCTNTKLTESDVRCIKLFLITNMDRKEISKMFNVKVCVVSAIAQGKNFDYILQELNDDIKNMKDVLSKERDNNILSVFDKCSSVKKTSDTTGYTVSVVEKCVYKNRNVINSNRKKYQNIYDEVFRLYNEGVNKYSISKILKISPSTVGRYLSGENNPYKGRN